VLHEKNLPESHTINPFNDQTCSIKMVGYWPRSYFCEFMGLDSVSPILSTLTVIIQFLILFIVSYFISYFCCEQTCEVAFYVAK